MDISTVSSSMYVAQQSAAPSKITSDFNTFLRMLTVQMQNQDPLKPIDSADYAVQLATFSGVEQQVRTNQLLADLQSKFQQLGLAEMAGWVGKEARSNAPVLYEGSPITLSPNPAVGSDRAVLVVRDSAGRLVSREEIPVSIEPYQWLGAGIDGAPLPTGTYTITLESMRGDTRIDARPVEHYARIVEAKGSSTGTTLVLRGGIEVPASSVTALRSPQG
ncbi:flagellar hook capping FlgD N-terminal domain-containing protein [Rhodobacter calidifons]|uniref:Basal-body rod modification protein FlgD n=1 Tax=Rhodobacter calidifons TaxID=2715277 RepID=A0ABX0G334_9RHOB|nr:flagellar hook capping FlgD N-terminal domain-containing protein [Rhodobacter calidifons]NHB75626.1 flagellar basal body rod modification protein [Rhodobacter calidifons]